MKKRLYGLTIGLAASITILLITVGVAGLLALTIIGLPLALIAAFIGGFLALAAPIVGFIAPDELIAGARKRWAKHKLLPR